MQKTLTALAAAVLGVAPGAAAQQNNEPFTVVQRFIDSFNKGDDKAVIATCADPASIIDEFPPYEWHGAGACANWVASYAKDAAMNGISDGVVTLGKPRHVDVTGDRAYIVVPADYAYKHKAAPIKETGSVLSIVLQKGPGGWKITAWSWAKN
jgi:ketosteroid isomerase-like protein